MKIILFILFIVFSGCINDTKNDGTIQNYDYPKEYNMVRDCFKNFDNVTSEYPLQFTEKNEIIWYMTGGLHNYKLAFEMKDNYGILIISSLEMEIQFALIMKNEKILIVTQDFNKICEYIRRIPKNDYLQWYSTCSAPSHWPLSTNDPLKLKSILIEIENECKKNNIFFRYSFGNEEFQMGYSVICVCK